MSGSTTVSYATDISPAPYAHACAGEGERECVRNTGAGCLELLPQGATNCVVHDTLCLRPSCYRCNTAHTGTQAVRTREHTLSAHGNTGCAHTGTHSVRTREHKLCSHGNTRCAHTGTQAVLTREHMLCAHGNTRCAHRSLRCVSAAEHHTAEQYFKTDRTKPRKHLSRSDLSCNTRQYFLKIPSLWEAA